MNGYVKTGLRIALIVAVVYVLAAVVGLAPGASVRGPNFRGSIGKRKHKNRMSNAQDAWSGNGMVGELIASPGTSPGYLASTPF